MSPSPNYDAVKLWDDGEFVLSRGIRPGASGVLLLTPRFAQLTASGLARLQRAYSLRNELALPDAKDEAAREGAAGADSRFATANGVKLHYLVAGQGPTVVLLHGYAETSRMWLPLMAQLGKTNTVIAPDLRGSGASDKPASGYDKKTMAADIHALAQALGVTTAKVVGHDIGLMVAYAYAAQYPNEVEKVVLMDAFLPGIGNWKEVWLMRDLWHFHFHGETPLQLVAGRERIYFEHFWNDFAADKTHSVPEADRRFYVASYAQPGGMRAGFEYFIAFPQDAADFEAFSHTKLKMPMLVLAGERASGPVLIEQAQAVAADVNGTIVKGSGHWLMEEATDQVIPTVTVPRHRELMVQSPWRACRGQLTAANDREAPRPESSTTGQASHVGIGSSAATRVRGSIERVLEDQRVGADIPRAPLAKACAHSISYALGTSTTSFVVSDIAVRL
jgi:pimeloyl-ACP methyl ester carboxylesterase